jgi:hypothetical protein
MSRDDLPRQLLALAEVPASAFADVPADASSKLDEYLGERHRGMTRPKRIQLSRRKGWRDPPGTLRVCRPSRFGNPFRLGEAYEVHYGTPREPTDKLVRVLDPAAAVYLFEDWLWGRLTCGGMAMVRRREWIIEHLGLVRDAKYIGCWCSVAKSCHGDTLISLASAGEVA